MEFLRSVTSREALTIIQSFPLGERASEPCALGSGLSRVLADDIVAMEDIPPFDRSLVDGFAVVARDTYGSRETMPALLTTRGEVKVGEEARESVATGTSVYLSTGAMLPTGADAVVMEEHVRRAGDTLEVTRAVRKGENVCFRGEDVREGSVVVAAGKKLSPFDLGVLASLGITTFGVRPRVRCGLFSSGNEVVPAGSTPAPGSVRDINSHAVAGLLEARGAAVTFFGIARDIREEIVEKLQAAAACDLVLVSGGSSKGQSDFITASLEELGGQILFHGINIRPGKPTIFANLHGIPVFGLPGHPVSCAMVVLRFVLPLLHRLAGETAPGEKTGFGVLDAPVPSTYGVEEYVRVTLEKREDRLLVHPLFAKSSVISSLSKADAFVVVPEGAEGLEKGSEVEVHYLG